MKTANEKLEKVEGELAKADSLIDDLKIIISELLREVEENKPLLVLNTKGNRGSIHVYDGSYPDGADDIGTYGFIVPVTITIQETK
jgi:hypothetical protein